MYVSHCFVCAFSKEFTVSEIEIVPLEIFWTFDMFIPDDKVKVDRYDSFESVNLCASAFGLPILKKFYDRIVVMCGRAMNHSVEIRFVFPIASFRFIYGRNRTFLQICTDMFDGLGNLIFAVRGIAAKPDCAGD